MAHLFSLGHCITADTALCLEKFFHVSAEFWLNLQKAYELDLARQEVGEQMESILPYQRLRNGDAV